MVRRPQGQESERSHRPADCPDSGRARGRCEAGWRGVSELQVDYGPGYRIYFCRRGEDVILLLCGGDKSTQDSDIREAKSMAKEIDR